MGYYRAGFEVVGVDIKPQPHYPFEFHQGNALEYCGAHGHEFDVIHASPPCQGYSRMRHLPWLKDREYPLLIPVTRLALLATGKPYVIENVSGAPLFGAELCGSAVGLPISRHRKFESNILLLFPACPGHGIIAHGRAVMATKYRGTTGIMGVKVGGQSGSPGVGLDTGWKEAARMMGIDWMNRDELSQAIPPAYTEYIGHILAESLTS